MTRGKSICAVLKTIRKQIADANEIKYEPRECHHQGECRGTCPGCEAEVKYIERQLDIRRQLGKAVAIVGISAGLSALSGCGDKSKKVDSIIEKECKLAMGEVMVEPTERLDGDVEYQSPVDTVIIEKDSETIKKRTAPFKVPQKEKEDMSIDEVMLGGIDIIKPSEVSEAPNNTFCEETEIFGDVVEQMPYFPGGTNALFEYLEENIKYPEDCEEVCIQGRVVITFVVEKDGSISDAKVVKSVYPSLDEEALRVVSGMPKWCPGKQNGRSVRTKYTIPVTFRLK